MIDGRELTWRGLSDRGAAIVAQIAVPISEGFSHHEVAQRLGITELRVGRLVRELRVELRELGLVQLCDRCGAVIPHGYLCGPCRAARRAARRRAKAAA